MALELNENQRLVQQTFRKFMEKEVEPNVEAMEAGEMTAFPIIRKMVEELDLTSMYATSMGEDEDRLQYFLWPTLTGRPVWDGGIGVALGLFICAHPAANAVNLLFFERQALRQVSSDGPLMRWLALNLLVLLVGWMVVFAGIRRLVERTIQ